jgi:hypothetical protein
MRSASFQEIMRRKGTTQDENEIAWQAEDGKSRRRLYI